MENKKNSVNLTDKKQKNKEVKREVREEEQDNKKIIIAALVLALVLGVLVYWQVSKKADDKEPSEKKKDNDVVEKTDDKKTTDTDKDDDDYYYGSISTTTTTTTTTATEKTNNVVEDEEEEEVFYSLSFETNGGNEVEKQVLSEDQKTESVIPVREGWSFAGWFLDEELTEEFIFGRVLTNDTTLYAKWVKFLVFKDADGEEIETRQSELNKEANLITKEELNNPDYDEGDIAWMMKTVDEAGEEVLVELKPGTVLTDKTVSKESDTVELTLRKLDKFEIEIYLSEEDDEPFDTIEAIEERPVDFTELDTKLEEMDYVEYALYYRDTNEVKWTFFRDQNASKDITKLFLDEAYTVIFKDEFKEENEEQVVTDTQPVENPVDDPVDNNEEQLPAEDPTIVKEELVAKDSQIKNENIPVPEEREGYEFLGWFLVSDDASEVQLTEDMIIDGDKVFIARWRKLEEAVVDEENDAVEPEEEENLENTEQPEEKPEENEEDANQA